MGSGGCGLWGTSVAQRRPFWIGLVQLVLMGFPPSARERSGLGVGTWGDSWPWLFSELAGGHVPRSWPFTLLRRSVPFLRSSASLV